MKYLLILISSIFLFNACSNEFEISEEFKDIPVVYALINPIDTANYIRLEKAFTSKDVSALEIALNPDSLYYMNASISIAECLNQSCTSLGAVANFEQVDGDQEGYPRKDGVFATAPNTIYKLLQSDFPIIPTTKYLLSIDRGNGLPIVTGTTSAIENPSVIRPTASGKLIFKTGTTTLFEWKYLDNALAPGGLFDVDLKMRYSESVNNGPFVSKELIWPYARNVRDFEIEKEGEAFFNFLNNNLVTDSGIKRVFEKLDFELTSGGPELLSYINIGLANLGITSTQDIPTFTNLSEGRGLFTSTNVFDRNNISLTDDTLDSLRMGHITIDLNFQ